MVCELLLVGFNWGVFRMAVNEMHPAGLREEAQHSSICIAGEDS
jgi:hypothetical protein